MSLVIVERSHEERRRKLGKEVLQENLLCGGRMCRQGMLSNMGCIAGKREFMNRFQRRRCCRVGVSRRGHRGLFIQFEERSPSSAHREMVDGLASSTRSERVVT